MKAFLGTLITLTLVLTGGVQFASAVETQVNVTPAPGTTINLVGGTEGGTKLENPIQYDNLMDFVAAVLKAAVQVLLPFVVLAFIWSGFLFIRAQGNEEQLSEAKTAIYWSVIGAFILLGAWGFAEIIATTVSNITGVQPM